MSAPTRVAARTAKGLGWPDLADGVDADHKATDILA